MSNTDCIEKELLLKAPQARVWRALSDQAEFGTWFKMSFDSPFAVGATIHGRLAHPKYEHLRIEMVVEAIEPQSRFAYRWHPYAMDTAVDYSKEPMTLVDFRLTEQDGSTLLRITECGFDKIPASRRDEAFRMNTGGWTSQIENIRRHVEG
jgi:uncharacterized protein YndB with AHSA1/START domain